ncbi:membrane protein, partial [Bacillus sp. SA1-12]|uniref:YczE/YyaS/YitT family protein n=1 Tax=Bacillus sp. SA1-12 TaxID=1455638 RepID=UPI00062610BA
MKLRVQIPFFMIGLTIFSYGISVAIQVQHLGIHPWDVLNIALFEKFGLTIGTWTVLVGLLLVVVSFFLDRSYINIGTFLNALAVGPLVDLFLYMEAFPRSSSVFTDVLVLILGVVLMGIGGGMYSGARIGAGPRDGFMLSISDKLGMSISRVRIMVESLVLLLGWLLGGPVFIFT